MTSLFRTRITVRGYELDSIGHVNGAVYLQYAEHAGWEGFRAAGVTQDVLRENGVAPIRLSEIVRYHDELRAGDDVDITTEVSWGEGKTFKAQKEFRRADGTLVAEVGSVGGVLDLTTRRLVTDPASRLRDLATAPELLGITASADTTATGP